MKQTAVEWLLEQFYNDDIPFSSTLFKKAKELEKQQIIDAIAESNKSNNRNVSLNSEQYYDETYKNERSN